MDNLFSVNTIIVIFIILFPGLIIRKSFYSNKFSKQFYRGQFSERLLTTMFWGIINLLIGSSITYIVLKLYFQPSCFFCDFQNVLYEIATINFEKKFFLIYELQLDKILLFVVLFFFNLFILPFLLGKGAFTLIRKLKLDFKYTTLSFSNHWHYFFKGEVGSKKDSKTLNIKSNNFRSSDKNISVLDILTIEGGQKYLYKGILVDYNLKDNNEDLDSIILMEPLKKKYDKDADIDGKLKYVEFEKIPGDYILIPYSSIININLSIKSTEIEKKNINQTQDIVNKDNSDDTNPGCFILTLLLSSFLIVCILAKDVSYLRFTLGLFLLTLIVPILGMSLTRKFTVKGFILFILFVVICVLIIMHVFKIYSFEPIISIVKDLQSDALLFFKKLL